MIEMVKFSLPKQAKLIKTDDFSSVFNLRKRIATPYLVMRFKPNALNRPRLGLIVAKKTAKLAVKRNYMRRVLRELFRLNQHDLPAVDLVIQAQKSFETADFHRINQEFEQLMFKLTAKNSEKIAIKTDAQ
jgi:ribonuclease P protein component